MTDALKDSPLVDCGLSKCINNAFADLKEVSVRYSIASKWSVTFDNLTRSEVFKLAEIVKRELNT